MSRNRRKGEIVATKKNRHYRGGGKLPTLHDEVEFICKSRRSSMSRG